MEAGDGETRDDQNRRMRGNFTLLMNKYFKI